MGILGRGFLGCFGVFVMRFLVSIDVRVGVCVGWGCVFLLMVSVMKVIWMKSDS